MDTILKKMNFKEGMKIKVWNLPSDLDPLINSWKKMGLMAQEGEKPSFTLAFVQTEEEVQTYFPVLAEICANDEPLWMAYPKGTSKKYKAQINRDSGWRVVGNFDFETVRQIAIDEDWSALRFRHIRFIKTLTRNFSTKNQ
ncbi:hypothetical protein DFQ04_2697 [Algoriphagus boseongensis]|uniref:DUF3052 family protein n=1 Tax=Algoriphagus boseongensis TaxID=1442587 RepID=A0A4R6T3J6_9BACT|nr:hypothetical protein [Algoriphagus boseongensis]TDQ16576.1 hypothetical protein DFQ04_2697 [Algoriphagus boseongensis]